MSIKKIYLTYPVIVCGVYRIHVIVVVECRCKSLNPKPILNCSQSILE